MKERIVIDNNQHLPRASYYVAKDGHYDVGTVNYATPETILNENRIVAVKEQVPETFDELIEICIDTFKYISVGESSNTNQKYMIIKELTFCENGNILNEKGYDIVVKRTPQQMWQIIMGLLGE